MSSPDEITRALEMPPDIERGKALYPLCAACHLDTGWGKTDGSFPVIAGQHRRVMIKQMADIRAKDRDNPTMYPFTDPQTIGSAQAISDVTAYIASLPPNPHPGQGDGRNLAAGEKLYRRHCSTCHGDRGQGNDDAFIPKLQGQHQGYLLRHSKWIRDGYRKNADPAMVSTIRQLQDADLDAITDYLSRL